MPVFTPISTQPAYRSIILLLLALSAVSAFADDSMGTVWIGTLGAGLSRLDLATREVSPFPPSAELADHLDALVADGAVSAEVAAALRFIPKEKMEAEGYGEFLKMVRE